MGYSVSSVATIVLLAINAVVDAYSLADIDHVVLFMQENRAFDHYYGTLAGVRGFSDPNIQVNDGVPVWQQYVDSSLNTSAPYLEPWYLNYLGGDWVDATQCMVAGSNSWQANHEAFNGGLNNHWAVNNTPWSLGYFQRQDIPVHYALADGWTVADMYTESVIAATCPNRVTWISGTITEGDTIYIDNSGTPGCEMPGVNCYPLNWTTYPESVQKASVSWEMWQDEDNFGDDPLAWFSYWQNLPVNSSLAYRGLGYPGLDAFYAAAKNGSLPMISWIIGPEELSEHPPFLPNDGAWLQQQIVNAMTSSPLYNRSALIVSWDETGGWADHVTPYTSPEGTPVEWVTDPYGLGEVPTGPGYRLPFYIVSPFTRGGSVFTEHADHNSQLLFLEEWLAAKGHPDVLAEAMTPWRRSHMSNLVNAFDFSNPDFSVPEIPTAPAPHTDSSGNWDGVANCWSLYSVQQPPVPFGQQNSTQNSTQRMSSLSEKGFKSVRGALTEGRYLAFESNGFALQNGGSNTTKYSNGTGALGAGQAVPQHDQRSQLFVIHQLQPGGTQFQISSAVDGSYLTSDLGFTKDSRPRENFTIRYLGGGQGYSVQTSHGMYLAITPTGKLRPANDAPPRGFSVFSVTGFT